MRGLTESWNKTYGSCGVLAIATMGREKARSKERVRDGEIQKDGEKERKLERGRERYMGVLGSLSEPQWEERRREGNKEREIERYRKKV